jgi:hypothetical protein
MRQDLTRPSSLIASFVVVPAANASPEGRPRKTKGRPRLKILPGEGRRAAAYGAAALQSLKAVGDLPPAPRLRELCAFSIHSR